MMVMLELCEESASHEVELLITTDTPPVSSSSNGDNFAFLSRVHEESDTSST